MAFILVHALALAATANILSGTLTHLTVLSVGLRINGDKYEPAVIADAGGTVTIMLLMGMLHSMS